MSRIDAHISSVQRKLTLAVFVDWLAKGAFVLAGLALLTIVLQRLIHFGLPLTSLWVGLGVLAVAALVLTVLNRPSREHAAVALDERLGLKEKFSTALSVRRSKDPFAQAVVHDAEQTAAGVRLAGHFPMEFPNVGYIAIGLAVLAVLAFMFIPKMDLFGREKKALAAAAEQRKVEEGRQIAKDALVKLEAISKLAPEAKDVQIAKAHIDKIAEKPLATREATARRVAEVMDQVEKSLAKSAKDNKEYAQAKATEKMLRSMNNPVEGTGPVAEAGRKLVKGDLEEFDKELNKAMKEFEKQAPKDQEQTAQQMKQLAQAMQQLAQDEKMQQQAQKQMQQAGMNQQDVQKAMENMQKAAAGDQQAAQQLQQQMQQAMQGMNQQQQQQLQQAMQQAQANANAQAQAQQMGQAAQQLAQAMQQAAANGQNGQQQNGQNQQQMQQAQAQMNQQVQNMMQQMQAAQQQAQQMAAAQQQAQQAAQQAAGQAAGQGQGQGNQQGQQNGPGQQGQWAQGDPQNKPGNGQGGPGQGAGGNTGKAVAPAAFKSETSKSHYDEKGKHLASVYVKDKSIRGDAKLDLEKAVAAGLADEGDDIDDTRIDRRTQKVMQEYFRVVEKAAAEGK
jgi:hypothetical protein